LIRTQSYLKPSLIFSTKLTQDPVAFVAHTSMCEASTSEGTPPSMMDVRGYQCLMSAVKAGKS
jgi:hypothetical protein